MVQRQVLLDVLGADDDVLHLEHAGQLAAGERHVVDPGHQLQRVAARAERGGADGSAAAVRGGRHDHVAQPLARRVEIVLERQGVVVHHAREERAADAIGQVLGRRDRRCRRWSPRQHADADLAVRLVHQRQSLQSADRRGVQKHVLVQRRRARKHVRVAVRLLAHTQVLGEAQRGIAGRHDPLERVIAPSLCW